MEKSSSCATWGNNQTWGTVLKPDSGLGYQKMTAEEVDAISERLHQPITRAAEKEIDQTTVKGGQKLPAEEVEALVDRLKQTSPGKAVCDSNRTGGMKESGVMNTFAWKGWN
ncbi:uncharacterized protein LOC135812151 [Sycon ciliatum]|uniref:uncharacterized protein LOC135812151 n=1 Tax=Sycon ciliatum TaxID=27933 RepID=UPI0020AB2E39|eukprot:scpid75165/ scgid23607/ 